MKKVPFLATYVNAHPESGKVIVLVTDNSHNLWKGVYLTGKNRGLISNGMNQQFFMPYEGKVEIDNSMLVRDEN